MDAASKNWDECQACPAKDKSLFASQLLHLLWLGKAWAAVSTSGAMAEGIQ